MMTLEQLFPQLEGQQVVTGLTLDSREAGPGMVFFALPGRSHDGREHIAQAVQAGASAAVGSMPSPAIGGGSVQRRSFWARASVGASSAARTIDRRADNMSWTLPGNSGRL